ncbi:hypothetical protein IGI04_026191 [Brassica rapa subsp. trilocularis]|uniref:RNase H type-1 domain-containing protein n=1 Tax=Brassica rapa subsp. trilocularis TaxID=1813537 RepID=A0ABQ7KVJ9_BRACM|nr:hypothetical protein IGI04_026191 [Brassica rapa subsp. trilocularis]
MSALTLLAFFTRQSAVIVLIIGSCSLLHHEFMCWWNQELISIFGTSMDRILLSKYIPSALNCWSRLKSNKSSVSGFDQSVLHEVINGASDKGITPLHVAAVKGHIDITLGFGSFCCSGLTAYHGDSEKFASIKFVVSKKPDGLYPVVSGTCNVAKVLLHSRRVFSSVTSLAEARHLALIWAIESMASHRLNKVIFETEDEDLVGAVKRPRAWPSYRAYAMEIKTALSNMPEWELEVCHHGYEVAVVCCKGRGCLAERFVCRRTINLDCMEIKTALSNMPEWELEVVSRKSNMSTFLIERSVTMDMRLPSYVARGEVA